MGLVFDTTHIALNGEDIFKALEQTGSQIKGIHLSNAVLDTASDLYGDNHIPPGEPGFLTEELIGQFLRKVDRVMEGEVKVAIEIRCREIHECRPVEKMARRILESHL
jgi:sugar phosphate isomerase/epimerase